MRQQAIEAMAGALRDYDYDGIEPSIATITYYLDEASDVLDALLVFLTEHQYELVTHNEDHDGFYECDLHALLAVLSADREDADGVS